MELCGKGEMRKIRTHKPLASVKRELSPEAINDEIMIGEAHKDLQEKLSDKERT